MKVLQEKTDVLTSALKNKMQDIKMMQRAWHLNPSEISLVRMLSSGTFTNSNSDHTTNHSIQNFRYVRQCLVRTISERSSCSENIES